MWKYSALGFLTLGVVIYFCGFMLVKPANAGLFSFLGKWFTGENTDADQVQSLNSQTMPILQAPKAEDLVSAIGGGDGPTIVTGTAILAEVGPLGSVADISDKPSQGQISIYVVQKGDNLSQIAKMFGVSVNTIIWTNGLGANGTIKIGQTLVILPVSGVRYEVKVGDTIESIVKKWKGDVNEIIEFNDLTPGQSLAVGATIIIPDGEAPLPPSSPSSLGSSSRGGSGPEYAGYYRRPVIGGRNSRATPSNPHGLHGWNAVDLAVPCGTPIVASASGNVLTSLSGWNYGYGNFILISHLNGTQTLYAHNSSNIVGAGWHVVQGQVIGYVGVTGKTTGCHVHFEIRGAKNPF